MKEKKWEYSRFNPICCEEEKSNKQKYKDKSFPSVADVQISARRKSDIHIDE